MTLHEYVKAYCPDGAKQLKRLILERTGVEISYAYVWKWCNPRKLAAVSVESASLLHRATEGMCSLLELQSLATIRERLGQPTPVRGSGVAAVAAARRAKARRPARKAAKPAPRRRKRA